MTRVFTPQRPAEPPRPGIHLQLPVGGSIADMTRLSIAKEQVPSLKEVPFPVLSPWSDTVGIAAVGEFSNGLNEYANFRVLTTSMEILELIAANGFDRSRIRWFVADPVHVLARVSPTDYGPLKSEFNLRDLTFCDEDVERSWVFWCEKGLVLGMNRRAKVMLARDYATPPGVTIAVHVEAAIHNNIGLPPYLVSAIIDGSRPQGVEALCALVLGAMDKYDTAAAVKAYGKADEDVPGPLRAALEADQYFEPGEDLMNAVTVAFDTPMLQ